MGLDNFLFYPVYILGKSTPKKKNTKNKIANRVAQVIRNTIRLHLSEAIKVRNGDKVYKREYLFFCLRII